MTNDSIQIEAKEVWGVVRALETLLQLIRAVYVEDGDVVDGDVMDDGDVLSEEDVVDEDVVDDGDVVDEEDVVDLVIQHQEIYDAPVYRHRGFMLDTARHYYPVNTIKKIMDSMIMNKVKHTGY